MLKIVNNLTICIHNGGGGVSPLLLSDQQTDNRPVISDSYRQI